MRGENKYFEGSNCCKERIKFSVIKSEASSESGEASLILRLNLEGLQILC